MKTSTIEPFIPEADVDDPHRRVKLTAVGDDGNYQARESAQKLPESLRDAVRRSGTASTIRSRGV